MKLGRTIRPMSVSHEETVKEPAQKAEGAEEEAQDSTEVVGDQTVPLQVVPDLNP